MAGKPEGCCLQDAAGRGCCGKDPCRIKTCAEAKLLFAERPVAAADPASAVGPGSAPRTRASRRDTASSFRALSRQTGAILLDPGRASAFGSGSGAAVARTCPNTRSARDEIGMARILAGRNGNTAGASLEPGPVTESRVLECKSSTGKRSAEASRSGGHRRLAG